MRSTLQTWTSALVGLTILACAGLATPNSVEAELHDPMRPSHATPKSTNIAEDETASALPPLHAILISATSKVAIFGAQRVHEGERIGRYRIKRIHPGRVELSDGDSHLERRLFPAITTFEDDR